jgi:ATP-dependent RNA helicase DDX54/DBP10
VVSENEFDISNALLAGANDDSENDDSQVRGPAIRNGTSIAVGPAEDDASDDEIFIASQQTASNRKASNLKGRTVKKGGGFQAMGLNAPLLKAITRKGFSVPTPIQRKAIPLIVDGRDVVGMARTGSGKTAAFVIPLVQRLKAHSAKIGARAMILSPSRELALQTLKVAKELGRGSDLRTILLVGGDSLEDQFGAMTSNPDVIIATPGRFLHLKVEMNLDLSSIEYVVFDEADRLFEMGFASQLSEILHGLPTSRQTLLFSATLPKSLVEFARAGLQEPKLVRLDAESKVSPDLESAFFTVKSSEKEGALLHLLQDIIKVPPKSEEIPKITEEDEKPCKKRKRSESTTDRNAGPNAHSTIIFAATKYHVQYLSDLLHLSGYAVSYVYGDLDQAARKMQVETFRSGATNVLVVTDVAARGIDIPVIANVVNYDFPSVPKIFVHRVGRTARAGRKGWSYSLVRDADIPYMLDLQLFLSRRLVIGRHPGDTVNFAADFVVGGLPREPVERCNEWVAKLVGEDADLDAIRTVASKGEKQYNRSRNAASTESAKRAKQILADPHFAELSMFFEDEVNDAHVAKETMLARVSSFRPAETIFEIGKRGSGDERAEMMRKVRRKFAPQREKAIEKKEQVNSNEMHHLEAEEQHSSARLSDDEREEAFANLDSASESELEVTFSESTRQKKSEMADMWHDPENFMSYTPRESNLAEDRGYGVQSGSNSNTAEFLVQARGATMDLTNDETRGFGEASKAKGMRWDKKRKKYIMRGGDEDGPQGHKLIRGESGQKIAASFRSGRFDVWKRSHKIWQLPKVGETERASSKSISSTSGKRFRHRSEKAPKEADRFRDDFFKQRKRIAEAKEKCIGKFKDGAGKSELRSVDDVRKQRQLKEKRREKNARPSKKRKL